MEFELTPVESRGGYLFKRDDLFMPYDFCRINGSKLRQCILLVEKNREKAAKGIITGTSVLSPQAAITSAVAKANGYPCSIYYGGTTPTALAKYDYPRLCAHLGADVRIVSRSGMTSVLNAIVSRRVEQTGELAIRYGFDLRNNLDVFISSVAQQCQNLPDHLDNLVMVVGSAITLIGVLCGISMYGKDVDRIVLRMMHHLGKKDKDRTVIEASSGNTGISLAMLGACLGFRVLIVIPSNATEERESLIRAYGAECLRANDTVAMVERMVRESPERYYWANQYNNHENVIAQSIMAKEIATQMLPRRIDYAVAPYGTSGTLMGLASVLGTIGTDIVGVFSSQDHIQGLRRPDDDFKPAIFDASKVDRWMDISAEQAREGALELASHFGIFVGESSGASYRAALAIAEQEPEANIVMVFPDRGDRYISTVFAPK